MQEMVNELKTKRQEVHDAKNQVTKLQLKIELSELGKDLAQAKAYLEVIQEEEKEIDNRLREAAIDYFEKTNEKKPVDGVSVVLNKSLSYETNRVILWAVNSHWLSVLKLDKAKFEKHARAVAETIPLEFVEIKEKPVVRIAKELK